MSHNPRTCQDCRSVVPCSAHDAAKREPRATVMVMRVEHRLTLPELRDLRARVDDAIGTLS